MRRRCGMKKAIEIFITQVYSARDTRSEFYFKGVLDVCLAMGHISGDEYVDICSKFGFNTLLIAGEKAMNTFRPFTEEVEVDTVYF